MKIKIFSRYFPPDFVGGAEVSTHHVAEALKDRFEIEINTLSKITNKTFKINTLKHPGAFAEMFPSLFSSRLQKQTAINSSKDIIWDADFFGAITTRGLTNRRILTIRDYWPICPCEMNLLVNHSPCNGCTVKNQIECLKIKESPPLRKIVRLLRYRLYYKFNQELINDADHIVFISNYIADKINSRIPVKNYSVINNPLGEEYITECPDKEITKNILFVGVVREYKGIDVILNALPAVIKEHKDIKLTVAGEGDIEKYMNKAARLKVEKHVTFPGKVPVSKMIDMYDRSDILVAPSVRPEPFGRTIIEGMARQCVPIASNHGGPVEIIKNGDTGLLFSSGDHKNLSQLILSLYEDENELREIQHRARADSIERFNPSVIAKQYEEIFLE